MKKTTLTYLLFLFFSILFMEKSLTQTPIQFEDAFNESNQEDQFRSYLDTISKYTYIDNQIVNYCLAECKILFEKELKVSNNDKLRYILILISSGLDKQEPLQSFQLIQDYQHLLDNKDISVEIKNQFSYLSAYTSFRLEDTKSAQEAFYVMYEDASFNKDTLRMIKALYSLGQIYSDDENYAAAIEHFNKVKKLDEQTNSDPSTFCLIQLELCATHLELKEYEKVLELIDESLEYIEKNKIREFVSDFLLLKGEIAFDKKDFKTAQNTLDESVAFMEASGSYYMLHASKIFNAKLLSAKGLDNRALDIYESLLKDKSELSNKKTLEIYELAHVLCNKTGQRTKAYQYLMFAKELQMEIERNKKLQQTAYLKIKFDSSQKDKENELLAAKFSQEQSQTKLLYALIALSVVGLFVLLGAYYQKQKFAQKLNLEVQNQTQELKQLNEELSKTNNELSEFNRILSHDLKEPLRSIVGFSNLARKEIIQNSKVSEYMSFIEKSGNQLDQIINDVSTFQSINTVDLKPSRIINPQEIIETISQKIKAKYPQKSFKINSTGLATLFANRTAIELVFLHLLENGILYNESKTAEIHIKYFKRNETHIFEFQDNGIGIEPEYQQQIFGMFKRLHARKQYTGSGLGLSMIKKVLKKYKGDINLLKSEQGQGSIFEVSLPIVSEEKSYHHLQSFDSVKG